MDEFLALIGAQAMRYAIRSGIALTSSYALGQCSRLLKSVNDQEIYSELKAQQQLLEAKIRIISPAIDLIEFKSGRGNIFLDSALPLTKSLRHQINSLGQCTEALAASQETSDCAQGRSNASAQNHPHFHKIISDIRSLLYRIDREIPLIQLAISASGESLSTSVPPSISPSRLLQASTLLTVGDTHYSQNPTRSVQIGPAFYVSLYMLFVGHTSTSASNLVVSDQCSPLSHDTDKRPGVVARTYGLGEGERKPLWQEVIHKARVRLCRSAPYLPGQPYDSNPSDDETSFAYHLEIVEDLDDGRIHDHIAASPSFDATANGGIQENIPVHELSKIFYTNSGELLNISQDTEGGSNPVLLFKRDLSSLPTQHPDQSLQSNSQDNSSGNSQVAIGEEEFDEQTQLDQQLQSECHNGASLTREEDGPRKYLHESLPKHLDPEWIAMEMFEWDEGSGEESDVSDESPPLDDTIEPAKAKSRLSLDSQLGNQIRSLSLQTTHSVDGLSSVPAADGLGSLEDNRSDTQRETEDLVARSPFGAITTSLSLLEMLVRLAGLQEFQQASHLSIPDHILTFFLEQTSTTGLTGVEEGRIRSEVRRKVGFDPYSQQA